MSELVGEMPRLRAGGGGGRERWQGRCQGWPGMHGQGGVRNGQGGARDDQ